MNQYLVKNTSICYWLIRAPSFKSVDSSRIEITATKLSGINLYMTVGKSAGTAKNEYLMTNLSQSLTFTFEPDQNVYVVAMAQDSTPSLAFTYVLRDYSLPLPKCESNQTLTLAAGRYTCVEPVTVIQNVTT